MRRRCGRAAGWPARRGRGRSSTSPSSCSSPALFATVVLAAGGVKGKGIADAVTEKIRSTIEGVAAKKG